LLFIGDPDQLPAVGAGSIFADLVRAARYPVATLSTCLRAERQELIQLARAVQRAQGEEVMALLNRAPLPLGLDELWEHYRHTTILSCLRRGPLGVEAINADFFRRAQEEACRSEWMEVPLLITRNQKELSLYNGMTCRLICRPRSNPLTRQLAPEDSIVLPEGRQLPALCLTGYAPAYALSVHQSQGSEYDDVLVLAPEGSDTLGREVLYTALTRAKKSLTLAVDDALLLRCLATSSQRFSSLEYKLKEC
jgi:exodeoxyribonuclease V alpha subunit